MVDAKKADWGRGGRLRAFREYLGLQPEEMAVLLRLALRTFQRMENGQAAIPVGVWADVDQLVSAFDEAVEDLIEAASGGERRVLVWRGKAADQKFPPGMWLRIVGTAMVDDPTIEPYFPEDAEVE